MDSNKGFNLWPRNAGAMLQPSHEATDGDHSSRECLKSRYNDHLPPSVAS